jgi:hypothetical protein
LRDSHNSLGSLESLLELPRRHVVSYHDIEAPGIGSGCILPIDVSDDGHFIQVRIETGVVPPDKKITLIIAAAAADNAPLSAGDCRVYVNSQTVEYVGPVEMSYAYSEYQHYAFSVSNTEDFPSASVAEFAAVDRSFQIDHVELRIDNR